MELSEILKLALGALAALSLSVLWALRDFIRNSLTTKLHLLPGPKSDSLLTGNLARIFKGEALATHMELRQTYGKTYAYRSFFNSYKLCTFDTRALHHILNTNSIYQKPELQRRNIIKLLGEGLLTSEDDQHKRQRRVMSPAFGNAQLRELTEIFLEVSAELRDVWLSKTAETGSTTLDALSWLSRATLEIIGKGGFGYNFNALDEHAPPNELNEAFSHVFSTTKKVNTWVIVRSILPMLQIIPDKHDRGVRAARRKMDHVGRQLIAEKKRALAAGEKGAGRDLLSLLIQANMDKDLPGHLKLTDDEVLGQIPTFLVAGHETTATTTTWCFFALTKQPDTQQRLRDELCTVDTETPTMDQLNALPYLDAVVRETLRVHSVAAATARIATQDDSIPLATPYLDRSGKTRTEIKITKGDEIFLPILAVNRERDIWGDDHAEFKPERWLNGVPAHASNIPGILPGVLTFSAGPQSCIGYRFAMLEMKALLFHLVRKFKIELTVPSRTSPNARAS
ncbi:cytochrome P450 [Auriculariales sp. MPI-PUGE-AT-0066]|nr:cytochrome P450 [Auriculariales sp. MPI-PUGE-AT-0066]